MNKQSLVKFLMAPLSLRCFIAYFFIIPFFFAIPYVKDILGMLPIKDPATMFGLMKTPNFWIGMAGMFLGMELLSGFCIALSNRLINASESPFDLTLPHISIPNSMKGFIYGLGWMLFTTLFFIFFVVSFCGIYIACVYVVSFLPTILKVLLGILSFFATFAIFIVFMVHVWISYMRFLKTWNIFSCFAIAENYHYLKKHKGRVLLALLIVFVAAQAVALLVGQVSMIFIPGLYPFNADSMVDTIRLVLCALVCSICFVYLRLLQTIVMAKAIAWIEYSPKKKK